MPEEKATAEGDEESTIVGAVGAMNGCGMMADDNDDDVEGDAVFCCVTVEGEVDDIEGGAMAGSLIVTEDDAACGHAMPSDFVGAAGEEEGGCGGRASLGSTAVFDEVEAERSILLEVFLAATVRAASLSVLLQEEHVLRGDHSPCLSLP